MAVDNSKYVCQFDDLNKLLTDELKLKFQSAFYDFVDDAKSTPRTDSWRLFFRGMTPQRFFSRFGLDFDHPTVRMAVALDMVKLNDGSVSNDINYTFNECSDLSSLELERMLLNRNYRINLIQLEPEWSNITYKKKDGSIKKLRTVERVFQGIYISDSILTYFKDVFAYAFNSSSGELKSDGINISDNVYLPFTNANDFYGEVSLIPNTHDSFPATSSRAYYDLKYKKYKNHIREYGINFIATFALVDQFDRKNHTGEYLVKVQKSFPNGIYGYIITKIDKDGQFILDSTTNKPYIQVYSSTSQSEIICLSELDYRKPDNDSPTSKNDGNWTPIESDVPRVTSSTSSHFSVFRQKIPTEDLTTIKKYKQFKSRLRGMELCLEQLNRDIDRKEQHCSEAFIEQTFAIEKLLAEFSNNKELMGILSQYYKAIDEYDSLILKKIHIKNQISSIDATITELKSEYNSTQYNQLDKKIELGKKIKTHRLEIDKSLMVKLDSINARLDSIENEYIPNLISEFNRIKSDTKEYQFIDFDKDGFKTAIDNGVNDFGKLVGEYRSDNAYDSSTVSQINISSTKSDIVDGMNEFNYQQKGISTNSCNRDLVKHDNSNQLGQLQFDTNKLHRLVLNTEKWRGYLQNLGYELHQLKSMYVKCEDATIKVRRLVHNFKERIQDVESQVWDSNHLIKENFSFKDISSAGIYDIILLHEWYASGASDKTYHQLGFSTQEQYDKFRTRCFSIALKLRKNQYATSLSIERSRLQDTIAELKTNIGNRGILKYDDKYGDEAIQSGDEVIRDIDKIFNKAFERLNAIFGPELNAEIRTIEQIETIQGKGLLSKKKESLIQEIDDNEDINLEQIETVQGKGLLSKKKESLITDLGNEEPRTIDYRRLRNQTIQYLKNIGLIQDESDIEKLATVNRASNFSGNISNEIRKLEKSKEQLNYATKKMLNQRSSIQSILDMTIDCEKKIKELSEANEIILKSCGRTRKRAEKKKLLLSKLDNETKIMELKSIMKKNKKEHFNDFKTLERMRDQVDEYQAKYDGIVSNFKRTIGIDENTIGNLLAGIYIQNMNEIEKIHID